MPPNSRPCLAHLARDVAYVVEASDDPVPWRLQLWLQSVFALAERITDLAASTLTAKRRSLDRQLGAILAAPSCRDLTRDLQAKIGRDRERLLVFLAYPGTVEATNKSSCVRASSSGRRPTDTAPCGPPRARPTSAPSSTPSASPAPAPSPPSSKPLAPDPKRHHRPA